ncbi:hypothetical protein BX616_009820 [Lobosporangium transversale]|uniref:Uncharacterized protein n=1 Tax=Lobosporangium transversale TaxID=64571 RepID=A0A1Y2GTD1_9FUNG|nr:hypothetical protein BCR41DRAFT_320128 [Lobosporangium transversale]KAF9913614.1 hypothetical protein BX616_009820 [Lobosporangium transversale]ORZ22751.1 hypothetical protein BCR41DRAFT_320128 [Lobosporangium transversale]|eukprot:XP_021883305.1 hypothetical protein BCR41DRAFT_320128 [Lobosporangium transversale]
MGLTKTYKDGTKPTVAIIGAGFSGMCAAIRLQTQLNLETYQVFELEPDLGGTWWSNTYPGAACDVASINYQFSFEPNYEWSQRYANQAEIWAYMRRVAKKYNLYEKIRFRTEVTRIEWNNSRQKWIVDYMDLSTGERSVMEADIVFSGAGPLRIPFIPKQFDDFEGPKWHTAQWNHSIDLTNKRVAIVGSGASAIQVVPSIVDKVKTLEYYQRTPSYIIPRRNGPYSSLWKFLFRYIPFFHFIYFKLNYYGSELTINIFSNKLIHRLPRLFTTFLSWGFRMWQVRDKNLREKLTPKYEMGCRRIVVASNYFPAVCKKNVNVHTEAIQTVKGNTLTLKDGSVQEVDALVLATGFKAQEMIPPKYLFGKNGVDLEKRWGKNPSTYYGITSPETPNMFFLLGPNTGLGHNSVLFMIETQVDYAIKAMSYMMANNLSAIEVTPKACQEFMTELDKRMQAKVWSSTCQSWYQNSEGRVTALWWGSCGQYWWRLRKFHPHNFVASKRI